MKYDTDKSLLGTRNQTFKHFLANSSEKSIFVRMSTKKCDRITADPRTRNTPISRNLLIS